MQPHLTPKELAKRWKTCEHTLARWRTEGLGPPFMKIQGLVLYRLKDIEACESGSMRFSTSRRFKLPSHQGD
jgi:hypothetical protein